MIINKIIKFPIIDSKKNLFFLVIFYYGIFFLPIILYAFFYSDDKIVTYLVPVETQNFHKSFFQICYEGFKAFLDAGRFYGIFATHFIIFYFFHDRLSYYIVKSLFNLIAVLSFAWLLKLITKDSSNSKAFIFLMPVLFMISIGVDPLTSHGLSTQYSAISIALASSFYILWRENKSKKYFFLSWIFFIWSFFHYEIGICIVPIFIVLAVRYRLKNQENNGLVINIREYFLSSIKVCFKELRFFFIPFFIWVLINIYLQNSTIIMYDGIEFNFDLQKFILSWQVQIIQSLPFGMLNFNGNLYWGLPETKDIFFASFLLILSYFIFLKLIPKINLKNNCRDVVLIGLSLILVPSGMISLSGKYQLWALQEIRPTAFIQIFLQFFGVGLLIIAYISYILENSRIYVSKTRQKIVIHFFAIIFSTSIALTNIFNYNIVHKKNFIEHQTQIKIFIKAIRNNVLQDFPVENNVNEKFYNKSRYQIAIKDFFEENFDKKNPKIRESFKDLNVFYSFFGGIYTSHFLSYYNKTKALLVNNEFSEENIEFFKKNIKLKNFYYADPWLYSFDSNFEKRVAGFVIAGKLDRIGYACNDDLKLLSGQDCYRIMNVLAPKIFIDKEFLFNLAKIINILNMIFGENIFKDSFEQIEENLKKSQDGILIKLDNRIYKIKR
jgi:hypothetical protein